MARVSYLLFHIEVLPDFVSITSAFITFPLLSGQYYRNC